MYKYPLRYKNKDLYNGFTKYLYKNKFFLITDEPQQNTQEHRFWEEMKDVPSFEMIPSDEAEKVAEIVENTGASRFL